MTWQELKDSLDKLCREQKLDPAKVTVELEPPEPSCEILRIGYSQRYDGKVSLLLSGVDYETLKVPPLSEEEKAKFVKSWEEHQRTGSLVILDTPAKKPCCVHCKPGTQEETISCTNTCCKEGA